MTKNGKIVLGCGAAALVIAVIVIIGGYFALRSLEKHVGEKFKADEDAGVEFGKTVDQQGCMDEGLRRARSMTEIGLDSEFALESFVKMCLRNSSPVQDFCAGVPGFWDLNDRDWEIDECHKVRMDESKTGCFGVFKGKYHFCSPGRNGG